MKKVMEVLRGIYEVAWGVLVIWWFIPVLIGVFVWSECTRDERQVTQYFSRSVQDDQVWSILNQGGGLEQECYWHYEIAVPQNADSSAMIAYYAEYLKTRKECPVQKIETREVLEVLQTRGIVYKRVYVGERSSIEQSFHESHPELEPDFDLQSRPKP